jgi:hypothetical protein
MLPVCQIQLSWISPNVPKLELRRFCSMPTLAECFAVFVKNQMQACALPFRCNIFLSLEKSCPFVTIPKVIDVQVNAFLI